MSDRFPYIRIRWMKLGGHIHCRVFTATRYDGTYAKCGELVFSEREWNGVCGVLRGVEILPEVPK